MKLSLVSALVVLSLLPGFWVVQSCTAKPFPGNPQTPSGDVFPDKSVIIYVADFDLQATHAPGTATNSGSRTANPPANATAPVSATTTVAAQATNSPAGSGELADGSKSEAQKLDLARADAQNSDGQKSDAVKTDPAKADAARMDAEDSPRVQAAKLVDLTATTLVKVLEQQGYAALRLRNGASAPDSGVVIRGVFAQVDPEFGIRRVVIGGLATDPKMLLFVGVGNLAKPEQAVYAVISPQPADNVGPLISVSAYAPVGRYELDRDPSEELLRRMGTSIAGDLTRLLNANPLALEQ
ncbi:MAG: DUF4410 domain-containing protein [Candidatus Acidiferrum sp.]|jgi:hypothetical protein